MVAGEGRAVPVPITKRSLTDLVSKILQSPADADRSLVAQGLDSLGAAELLEELQLLGFDVEYEFLLGEANIERLIEALHEMTEDRPESSGVREPFAPVDLSGPQILWTQLDAEGWGAWANISLCLSIPASLIRAPFLPAISQSLCDANEAMRMVLVQAGEACSVVQQRVLPDFQIPIEVKDAPASDRDAMRLIESFEGKECSPFAPSTRALILSSPETEGRHWLCITMHHVFSDRISMHNLARQVQEMVSANRMHVAELPDFGFSDVAVWKNRSGTGARGNRNADTLGALLARADISTDRPVPRAANPDWHIFGSVASKTELRPSETKALEAHAARLGTTLPLLLHAVSSVLIAYLTDDQMALSGDEDILLCHVVSNRERYPMLKGIVGCLDTSVPVAVRLAKEETLSSLCRKTHEAFSSAHLCASGLPRGSWIEPGGISVMDDARWTALINRFSHINIIRSPATEPRSAATDIREHSVQRAQQTRWGLLMRVTLPLKGGSGLKAESTAGTVFQAFAEDRVLAGLVPYCLVETLRGLLSEPEHHGPDLPILDQIARVVDRVDFAAAQVRRTSALVVKGALDDAFIYEKLVARQQRWYQHDAQYRLRRDARNRFVGTDANPFPFTQLDKLKERRFLEKHDVQLPRLLHILPKKGIAQALIELAPELPKSFVIKPVGAGHSFGVTVVRNGVDMVEGGVTFDPVGVGSVLCAMAERGSCLHDGKVFPFNFSSFLIEEFVVDERGFPAPTDYKVFMIGETFLWLQVHFVADGFHWIAFLDAEFRLLPQPAWDPTTCWRTHRALVCSDQVMADARKPACLTGILEHSRRLAGEMGLFVRLDWYADQLHGPLMGEITTFPHMLQPRGFYAAWANDLVKSVWQEPDGVAPQLPSADDGLCSDPFVCALELLDQGASTGTGIEAFLPSESPALWSVGAGVTYDELLRYVAGFDLAPWGVAPGARVGVLVANGVQFAALLLATMNRYVAVPVDPSLPIAQVAAQVEQDGVRALVIIAGSDEALKAVSVAQHVPGFSIIELTSINRSALAELPPGRAVSAKIDPTPTNCLDDEVLVLRTSGASGDPKNVGFTLSRLMRSGAIIGTSLNLSPADLGISMLPLHHIGGIACNLIAPLLASAGMHHRQAFDPKYFFDALAGPKGATWCYLVPAMWRMVMDYARAHPELRAARRWSRLRAIRSAGAELPEALARDLSELFGDSVAVLPTYGMTEAMPIAAPPLFYRLERPRSVGHVLPSVSVEIVDHTDGASMPSVADGLVGEITVRGPCVFDGYAESNGIEPENYTPRGYFRTGDLGCLAADGSGWLRIEGRIKDMINTGGETISPAHVEDIMSSYPAWCDDGRGVELMSFARTHRDLGEDVALAVIGASADMSISDIYNWAAESLPITKVPKTLVHLFDLPRSGNGKLKRAQFAKLFNAQTPPGLLGTLQTFTWHKGETTPRLLETTRAAPIKDVRPTDPMSVSLDAVLEVIRQHTGPEKHVGPDTSLVDAGINSLAAVELSLRLGERFQLDLPTWILSDHPTPRDVVSAISELKVSEPGGSIAPSISDLHAALSVPATRRSSVRRMLFLHGEGADADLMEKSLKATHWTGQLSGKVDFVFLDAPHVCAPMPAFHAIAVEAGLYKKPEYRSWGVTRAETLQLSLSAVRKRLEELGPIDAIGGICDGALVAALTASQRQDLTFFLSMSPSPLTRLSGSWDGTRIPTTCRSLHLISGSDAEHSLAQQLEITEWCDAALIIKHDRGHAVPRFTAALEQDVLQMLSCRTSGDLDADAATLHPLHQSAMITRTKPISSNGGTYETIVAKYTARILRQAHIDRSQNFFDAGGDSLKAMVLAMKLEQKLGMDLPFELLFNEGATVESMARAIALCRETNTSGTISPIGHSTSAQEIFALPLLNGHHSAYLAIARALADTAKIVGVKPPMLGRGVWRSSARLQDIAREAATTISNYTECKSINLVGCSAGGVLALETARVLAGRGYEIGCLAIIDSDFSSDSNRWPVPVKYLAEWQKHISRSIRGKTNLRRGYRHLHFRAQLADWNPEPVKVKSPIFFKADSGNIDEGQIAMWREVIEGDLDVIPFAGPHEGFVVPEVAETIAQAIKTRGGFVRTNLLVLSEETTLSRAGRYRSLAE